MLDAASGAAAGAAGSGAAAGADCAAHSASPSRRAASAPPGLSWAAMSISDIWMGSVSSSV